jgi:hypothetical protein
VNRARARAYEKRDLPGHIPGTYWTAVPYFAAEGHPMLCRLLVLASLEDVVGVVAAIAAAIVFFFACFVSPVVVLTTFCDARTVFRWISRRSNNYIAWLFFIACVGWLVFWYLRLAPFIAQVFVRESGVR